MATAVAQQTVVWELEDGDGDVRCSNPFPFGATLPYLGHSFPLLTPIQSIDFEQMMHEPYNCQRLESNPLDPH